MNALFKKVILNARAISFIGVLAGTLKSSVPWSGVKGTYLKHTIIHNKDNKMKRMKL